MFKWLNGSGRGEDAKAFTSVTSGLQTLYRDKMLPIEQDYHFHSFFSPQLTDADFSAKPMVLLSGQYSVGKSTFIRHMLGRDYPGMRIGPEPTTDKFVAICKGDRDEVIPGNAVVVDKTMPFQQLTTFGNAFLQRFECAKLPSEVLNGITLIDTPGVLSGEKQRIKRGYEFENIMTWWADRVDMIILLFDVSKLDISDELRRVILAMKDNDHKIHIVLNKADHVTTPQLMRVYGALMWSLGKVMDTPEVSRVYIGSFWDNPLEIDELRRLFESEANDLYTHLAQLPRGAATRKLNDVIKRARLVRVLVYLLDHIKKKLPMFGKDSAKAKLVANLRTVYDTISKEKNIALGDFPAPDAMQQKLQNFDVSKLCPKFDKKKLDALDDMLAVGLPQLLKLIPQEQDMKVGAGVSNFADRASPFAVMKVGGATEATVYESSWLVPPDVSQYVEEFMALEPDEQQKLSGAKAKPKLVESKLPSSVLHKIWTLADRDRDGSLTLIEFALAVHLIKMKLDGHELPTTLPESMIPVYPETY